MKRSALGMSIAACAIAAGLCAVSMVRVELVSIGTGVVDVNNSALQIKSPSTGYVSHLYVDAGSKVKEGDPLITFANQDLIFKEKSLNQTVKDLQERKRSLSVEVCATTGLMNLLANGMDSVLDVYNQCKIEHGNYSSVDAFVWKFKDFLKYSGNVDSLISAKKAQLMMIEKNINLSEKKISRMQRHGAISLQIESAEQELNTQRQSLSTNKTEIMKLDMERSSKKTALFNEFSAKMIQSSEMLEKTKNSYDASLYELQLYELKIKRSTINSPINGAVLSIEKNVGTDYYLGESEPIMILKKTSDNYEVSAKFNSKYRSSIHVGTKVRLQPSLLGVRDTFDGVITHISEDSFDDNKSGVKRAGQRYYKVKIKPSGKMALSSGTEITAYAISDKITVLDYVLSVFEHNKPIFENFKQATKGNGEQ
ncbi:HlyD family secretion protein [Photobacterium damselae]|uniref:HlyD family secretion protein n=1 Tax=Photobacterium damselae TaxID=38293 RepID=UPI001F1FA2EE|nr:HlyD family efflux transporter periplasmic adaptor subunit [Photobacterium damselae]UKA04481.1 HlyD family secretion protein [Photobacterium damselae subsp. damselae]